MSLKVVMNENELNNSIGIETNELNRNAMGGTEMMQHALYSKLSTLN